MKSIGELMQELGFNPKSSEGAQRAFFNYLANAARVNESRTISKSVPTKANQATSTNAETKPIKLYASNNQNELHTSATQPTQLQFQFLEDDDANVAAKKESSVRARAG